MGRKGLSVDLIRTVLIVFAILVAFLTLAPVYAGEQPSISGFSSDPVSFNSNHGGTVFSYALHGINAGKVSLEISDPHGNVVRAIDGGVRDSGAHQIVWDGRDAAGNAVGQGVYTARLSVAVRSEDTYDLVLEWGGLGTRDGQLNFPTGIAVDGAGCIYVAELYGQRIQKFDSDGNYLAKWGSPGSSPGQFSWPVSVAVDGADRVYVADMQNNNVQVFDSSGNLLAVWGGFGFGGPFMGPTGLAADGAGNIYVAEAFMHRIQKYDQDGNFLTTWGSFGSGDGQFNRPRSVAVGTADRVYVPEQLNHRVQQFDSSGNFLAKWGSRGPGDGQFDVPSGIAVDGAGCIYVVELYGSRVQKFDQDGNFLAKWSVPGSPQGIAVDGAGSVYVVNSGNHRVQKFSPPDVVIASAELPIVVDNTPPGTLAFLTGPAGKAGWFTGPVVVTLRAKDALSGVEKTGYSFDGATWFDYTEPFTVHGDGIHTVRYRSLDKAGNEEREQSVSIRIDQTPPVISISAPGEHAVLPVGFALDFAASDATSGLDGEVFGELWNGSETVHVRSGDVIDTAGVYTLTVRAEDRAGNTAASVRDVVVYDPEGGFVTGGGWISSPKDAYPADRSLEGRAVLSFVSRYQKGHTVPHGKVQFQFQSANLRFNGTGQEWLVIAGHRAQCKGSGRINNAGDYGFLLTAIDGKAVASQNFDSFRIKIWDKATGDIVYDNQMGASDSGDDSTRLGGGSIVIHGAGKGK